MGVLGSLFPGPEISDEGGESGEGQPWRLGPIDLENGTVDVVRASDTAEPEPDESSHGPG
ncbi:MAG: hypothetical protein L0H64_10040 [Pseudonocardia sp.]|nr:hypothetical protein [Pseudonocardia sp.]